MSWIARIAPENAPPELRAALRPHSRAPRPRSASRTSGRRGASHPAGLDATFAPYRALMDDPAPLTPRAGRVDRARRVGDQRLRLLRRAPRAQARAPRRRRAGARRRARLPRGQPRRARPRAARLRRRAHLRAGRAHAPRTSSGCASTASTTRPSFARSRSRPSTRTSTGSSLALGVELRARASSRGSSARRPEAARHRARPRDSGPAGLDQRARLLDRHAPEREHLVVGAHVAAARSCRRRAARGSRADPRCSHDCANGTSASARRASRTPSRRVHGKFSIHDACEASGSISCTFFQHARRVPPVVPAHLRARVRAQPLGRRTPARARCRRARSRPARDESRGARAQSSTSRTNGEQRLDAQRDRAGIRHEGGRDAVRHRREHRHAERLGGLDRDALGQDRVGGQAQVRVLLGAADRQHRAIVALELLLDLHPVHRRDLHPRASPPRRSPAVRPRARPRRPPPARARARLAPARRRRVLERAPHRLGERRVVAGRREQPGHLVLHQLRNRADARGHDRPRVEQRLGRRCSRSARRTGTARPPRPRARAATPAASSVRCPSRRRFAGDCAAPRATPRSGPSPATTQRHRRDARARSRAATRTPFSTESRPANSA